MIVDDNGLPVTLLVAATFPTLTYSLAGANADVAFPALSDLATLTTAWAAGGVKERGNGVYRLDLPDGVFTTAGEVKVRGEATGKHVIAPWIDVAVTVATVSDKTGFSLSTAGVAAIWNSLTSGMTTVGSIGKKLADWVLGADSKSLLSSSETGAGLSSVAPAATALSTANWTNARAGYLDNLNVGGVVASHADIMAINQSASKHLLLTTVGQYEPGETYTIEMRTFAAVDGSAVNADTTPTLTATGQVSGSLAANLSAATNPATGVYRWTYTPGASPTLEQIRFDGSATISAATFTLACYSQTIDEATAVFTATDQSHLTAIFNKLPANNIADETVLAAAIAACQQAGSPVTLPNNPPTGFLVAASFAASSLNGKGDWAVAGAQMDLVNAPNATAVGEIQNGLATAAALLNVQHSVEADKVIDTAASPWAEVWIQRGTGALGVGTELFRKSLYDSAGTGITDTTTVVAGARQ